MAKYIVFLALCVFPVYGQTGAAPLTNDTIIRLVGSGVSTDTIIKTIQAASSVNFGFLPNDLALLQRWNVPDDLVKAMAAKSNGRPMPTAATTPIPSASPRPIVRPEPQPAALPTPVKVSDDASAQMCSFTVFAQLVDKDLNLKPLPKLKLGFRESSATRKRPFTTSFEGRVSGELPCGMYNLTSDEPIEFGGKTYAWDLKVRLQSSQKSAIELSVDNAAATQIRPGSVETKGRVTDELITYFRKYEGSVVTVWSEFGHGTGFFVDDTGLVITNQHVVGPSEYLAVQSDADHKVRAVLLASDPQKDIAVLWVDRSALPGTLAAPIARPGLGETLALEGERVFTIGSPLNQRKIMTTGIVSKVEPRAIISDININHGNSGGPLFNSLGSVIGVTTFLDSSSNGPGISGIVRIEEADDTLASARAKLVGLSPPSPALLPVEPAVAFPVEGLKSLISSGRLDVRPYVFEEGDFDVAIITPVLQYRIAESGKIEASKEKSKRSRKSTVAAANTFQPLDDLKNWAEYLGEYRPVIQIRVTPKLRETFGSALARGLTARNGVSTMPAKMRFKSDFYRMSLQCGGKEIQPIHPGKIAKTIDVRNRLVNVTDATYEGLYTYPADAISPNCADVSLDVYSEKDVLKAKVKALNPKTVDRIWADFQPVRDQGVRN